MRSWTSRARSRRSVDSSSSGAVSKRVGPKLPLRFSLSSAEDFGISVLMVETLRFALVYFDGPILVGFQGVTGFVIPDARGTSPADSVETHHQKRIRIIDEIGRASCR